MQSSKDNNTKQKKIQSWAYIIKIQPDTIQRSIREGGKPTLLTKVLDEVTEGLGAIDAALRRSKNDGFQGMEEVIGPNQIAGF